MEKRRCTTVYPEKDSKAAIHSETQKRGEGLLPFWGARTLELDNSALQPDCDGVRPIVSVQFSKDVRDMALDRFFRDR